MNLDNTPIAHTTQPVFTGASVVGLKYNDGVLILSDTNGCYGGMKKSKNFRRTHKVSENTAMGNSAYLINSCWRRDE
jgi:20S proteasome subunit beta 7